MEERQHLLYCHHRTTQLSRIASLDVNAHSLCSPWEAVEAAEVAETLGVEAEAEEAVRTPHSSAFSNLAGVVMKRTTCISAHATVLMLPVAVAEVAVVVVLEEKEPAHPQPKLLEQVPALAQVVVMKQ